MSVFSDMAASARAAHSHFFGASVTLTEPGSAAAAVDVVLGTEQVETRREDNVEVRVTVRECRFVTLTTVRHDATVTIDGTLWAIDQFLNRQASGLTVKLRRKVAHEVSRTGYRGKG